MKFYALVLVAALNPLVMRTPEPNGNVPADCEVGDDAPLPRIVARTAQPDVAPEPEEAAPLPRVVPGSTSTSTRYDLRALQNAIARNDRSAFDAELASAKAGGAQVRVYEDVGRLWDAQFESPFFAEGSAAHRIATQYPGYEAAVRTQVYTDATGKKFYPAAESRAFVAKQAGVTLASTGRVAKSPTNVSIAPTPKPRTPATKSSGKQPDNRTTRQPSNRATPQPRNRTTSQPKKTVPRDPAPPSPSPDPSAARVAAATEPAPVVPQVGNTSSTQAPSAAGSLPPTETTATDTMATDTMVTDTMVTDTATDTTASIDTAVTATDVPATTTGVAPKNSRRIVLPAILILIGLGVLILLFRAR